MRVYIASKFANIQGVERYAEQLRSWGHEVVSRWHRPGVRDTRMAKEVDREEYTMPREAQEYALADLEDLHLSDVVISLTHAPGTYHRRGGRHVEFGYGLARGKTMIIVGPRENVFHTLPEVLVVHKWGLLLKTILSELEV